MNGPLGYKDQNERYLRNDEHPESGAAPRTDPIPDDVMDRVLQAAAWAPTGGNMQPWRVIVVTSSERKQALADIYKPAWYRYAKGYDKKLSSFRRMKRKKREEIESPATT